MNSVTVSRRLLIHACRMGPSMFFLADLDVTRGPIITATSAVAAEIMDAITSGSIESLLPLYYGDSSAAHKSEPLPKSTSPRTLETILKQALRPMYFDCIQDEK